MVHWIKTRVYVLESGMLPLVLECYLEVRNYASVYAKIDPRPSGATDCRSLLLEGTDSNFLGLRKTLHLMVSSFYG